MSEIKSDSYIKYIIYLINSGVGFYIIYSFREILKTVKKNNELLTKIFTEHKIFHPESKIEDGGGNHG